MLDLQGWPTSLGNGQTGTNGTGNAGMYGTASSAQQTGYGTGQDAFAQSSGYPTQAPFVAFGQQPAGYGGTQVWPKATEHHNVPMPITLLQDHVMDQSLSHNHSVLPSALPLCVLFLC